MSTRSIRTAVLVLSVLSLAFLSASAQVTTPSPVSLARGPVSFIALPPPPPNPGYPGTEVFCPADMWYCPCDIGETTCPVVELPSDLPVLFCSNELYDREVIIGGILPSGGYHTFWYAYMHLETGPDVWIINDILDGGPSTPCPSCGFLNAWDTPGIQGEETGDNINNPAASVVTTDAFGPNLSQCRASWAMKTYVKQWPDNTWFYKPITGPNSNTVTHDAAIAAALPVVEPEEWVPGW